jgi:hypothetical protein
MKESLFGERGTTGGTVTSNCAEAELAAASSPVMVCRPTVAVDGIVIVAVKLPVLSVVTEGCVVDSAVPSNLIVIADVGAKPVPFTSTRLPAGPEVGSSVIEADAANWVTTPFRVVVSALTVVANGLVVPNRVLVTASTVVESDDAGLAKGDVVLSTGLMVEELGVIVENHALQSGEPYGLKD